VPREYAHLFKGATARAALDTHRGYDLGALSVARSLGRRFRVPVFHCDVTRLLVDVNRSVGHPRLLSEFSRKLTRREREAVLERYYFPHRRAVEAEVARPVAAGRRVLHLSVHSFTPELEGRVRTAEVGLLYDPRRAAEREFCLRWVAEMQDDLQRESRHHKKQSDCGIRRNYPYRGASDGLTTALRRSHPDARYFGVEVELNQAVLSKQERRRQVTTLLARSLKGVLDEALDERRRP
jgi:predicted N-formylglutamate amidohydrolase